MPRQTSYSADDALLGRRIVVLRGGIDDDMANVVIAKMLYLQSIDARTPLSLHIDSPGGLVASALAIRDAIDEVTPAVHTHVLGDARGIAALVLAHGARGHRSITAQGQVSFTPITGQGDMRRTELIVVEMLAKDTGQGAPQIGTDLRASRSFDAEQARAYGLVDRVAG